MDRRTPLLLAAFPALTLGSVTLPKARADALAGQTGNPAISQAPPVVPAAQRLTLAQAVQICANASPLNQASRYTVQAAQANYCGQKQPLNPIATFAAINNSVNPLDINALKNPSNYSFYQTIETSGRVGIRARLARAQLNGAMADAATTALNVREAVTAAYVNLQVADQALADEQDAYKTSVQIRDLAQQQFKAGAAPETNAIRAQVALTQEEANLFTAISNVETARAALNIQLGRNAALPVDASEPLTFHPIHPKLEDLQAQALRSRPELVSARFNRSMLRAAVDLQRAQYYPDLTIGTDARFDQAFMGFTLPLFDYGSIRSSVRQAQKNLKTEEAQTAALRQSIELQVAQAYELLMAAEQTVEAFQSGTLPQSELLLGRVEKGYKLGFSTILDIIDAQNNLRAVRIAYYGALGSYRTALSQVEGAVGAAVSALDSAPLRLAEPRP
ncbi:MAG TPA: TolC family protein [Chthonomonadales bacterium]|nr:TolC family protein [Chthonomonadales bacterium]